MANDSCPKCGTPGRVTRTRDGLHYACHACGRVFNDWPAVAHGTDKFWLVWCETNGSPTHKHLLESDARCEAERLARLHPGSRFDVMELIASCQKTDVLWREAGQHKECAF